MTNADENDRKPSFEEALAQLEGIVHELEEGNVDLESSLARYEQGVRLLRQCYQILDKAERKIEILKSIDASGEPVVEPLDDEDLSLDEKSQQRDKRRSSPATSKRKSRRTPAEGDTPRDTDVDLPGGLF